MASEYSKHFTQADLDRIVLPFPDKTLYIIGNGFDMMHGVPSDYHQFRNFLGKDSEIRLALEQYLTKEDLWADFEDSLAHIDSRAMLNVVDDWLELYGVSDPSAQAADFFTAVESAVLPAQIIRNGLPEQFRLWVDSLSPRPGERPLEKLLSREGSYLNFNYTEFLETLYDIPRSNILYIHGCRKDRNQELVLGHAPGAEDGLPLCEYGKSKAKEGPENKDRMIQEGRETAAHYIAHYEEATTKHTHALIRANRQFFRKQADVRDVAVIGHSLCPVDYPYFREIIKNCENPADVNWHISWYCEEDLKRSARFAAEMHIRESQIELFKIPAQK